MIMTDIGHNDQPQRALKNCLFFLFHTPCSSQKVEKYPGNETHNICCVESQFVEKR